MKIDDPQAVARQYATEDNLEARRSLYENADGPDPRALAFDAVAEVTPARVLEVGGGPGELAARIATELGCEVVMVDISPRMVELARERGVDAFSRENGAELIGRHFERVERRDADGWVIINDHELVRGFVASLDADEPQDPGPYDLPIRTRRASSIFVATKAGRQVSD